MKRLLLENARVLDPVGGIDGLFDLVVMGGRVASVKPSGKSPGAEKPEGEGWQVIDCTDKLVIPGLVDIHTHLREPGEEYKETVKSGTEAAAAGGVTTVCCMANTTPVNDNAQVTRYILSKATEEGVVNVRPIGAVTVGLKGKALTEFSDLKDAGCVALSDDGIPIMDGAMMRRALEYSKAVRLPVITHAEDCEVAGGGVMNEGATSTRLGLFGMPNSAEDVMVARDVSLAELTGAHLHVAHVSTRGAVELIRAGKARGVNVTAEVAPHHLFLTDEAVLGYDTDAKMNPPLRTQEDVDGLLVGLKDGTIDCVATDHAPHSSIEKDVEFDHAANGVVGLETSLSLMLSLVDKGVFSLTDVVRLMSVNPAKIMGINAGSIKVGATADIAVVDLERAWTVNPDEFRSKGRNTPFKGVDLKGRVVKTLVAGEVVFELD